jgi:hypothetical protein
MMNVPGGTARAPEPDGVSDTIDFRPYRSRLAVSAGGERLVIVAEELFATAGGDLRATIRRNLPTARLGDLPALPLDRPGLQAYQAPASADAEGPDLRPLQAVFVVQPDETVQVVSFFGDRAAMSDSEGARATALRMARTLTAGPRKLATGSVVMQFPESSAAITALLPDGFVAALIAGPGYAQYDLRRLVPMGSVTGFVRLSLGHGQALYTAVHRIHDYKTVPGTLLGVPTIWRQWFSSDDGLDMRETLVSAFKYSGGRQGRCHIRVAARPEDRKALDAILDSLAWKKTPS